MPAQCLPRSDTALRGCLQCHSARLMGGTNPLGARGTFPSPSTVTSVTAPSSPLRLAGRGDGDLGNRSDLARTTRKGGGGAGENLAGPLTRSPPCVGRRHAGSATASRSPDSAVHQHLLPAGPEGRLGTCVCVFTHRIPPTVPGGSYGPCSPVGGWPDPVQPDGEPLSAPLPLCPHEENGTPPTCGQRELPRRTQA